MEINVVSRSNIVMNIYEVLWTTRLVYRYTRIIICN